MRQILGHFPGQPYIGASRGLQLFHYVEGLSFCVSPLAAFQSPAPHIHFSLADLEPHGKDGGEWNCFLLTHANIVDTMAILILPQGDAESSKTRPGSPENEATRVAPSKLGIFQ